MICKTCGLPMEICVCADLDREQTIITIRRDTARWDKTRTLLENVPNPKQMAKVLKRLLATGGTVKNGVIILMGDHVSAIIDYFIENGYKFNNRS